MCVFVDVRMCVLVRVSVRGRARDPTSHMRSDTETKKSKSKTDAFRETDTELQFSRSHNK